MKFNQYFYSVVVIGLLFPGLVFSSQIDSVTLFQAWSKVGTVEKHFTEEQFDSLLEISQHKSGIMQYRSPSFLKQHYQTPFEGTIIFSGKIVNINFPNRQIELSLENAPIIAVFSETLLQILNGNLDSIKQNFKLEFLSKGNQFWKLRLIPNNQIKNQLRDILLQGENNEIQSILFTQVSGDWRKISLNSLLTDSASTK